ncbi:MAG: hypothetical protein Q9169_001447 [Polycauliona sp. 2 TL-2023]
MSTLSLPVIDLANLNTSTASFTHSRELAVQLGKALEKEGFAYLVNVPLTLDHEQVFAPAKNFFRLPEREKLGLAKKAFGRNNNNTYRGFFPTQSGSDNLKEGFEIGPREPAVIHRKEAMTNEIDLTEANVWPAEQSIPGFREQSKRLHAELQALSSKLLSLIAMALGKDPSYFDHFLPDSVSTLRYLHYPAIDPPSPQQELCCTPHTDSGILTLLHQDSTGGLEVLDPHGEWVAAPYVPGSVVVNIGDLMAKISGGRFRATFHRVRSSPGKDRYSVPFFFEPGIDCAIHSIDGDDEVIVYGEHVVNKMKGWVEFQDPEKHTSFVDEIELIEPDMMQGA